LRRNSTSQGAFGTGAFRGGGGLLFGSARALLAAHCIAPEKNHTDNFGACSRRHTDVAMLLPDGSLEREPTPPFVPRRSGFLTSVAEKTQAHRADQQDVGK
jgi:hypothetical protein